MIYYFSILIFMNAVELVLLILAVLLIMHQN